MNRDVETYTFEDDGLIPNSKLPVLVYHEVAPASWEELFADNNWAGAWRNGIYPFHHFHSTSHEVLGIARGSAEVVLGGPGGRRFSIRPGDVLVLPAGTGHCNAGGGADLLVIGAYPNGMSWDLRRGAAEEREEVLANVAAVPLPDADPVHGRAGPLVELWG
jgi:uncharacterized protein YjlB